MPSTGVTFMEPLVSPLHNNCVDVELIDKVPQTIRLQLGSLHEGSKRPFSSTLAPFASPKEVSKSSYW